MHLGYLEAMRDAEWAPLRRSFLKRAGTALVTASVAAVAKAVVA